MPDNIADLTLERIDKILIELGAIRAKQTQHDEVMVSLSRSVLSLNENLSALRQINTTIAQLYPMLAERNDRADTRYEELEKRISALESQPNH